MRCLASRRRSTAGASQDRFKLTAGRPGKTALNVACHDTLPFWLSGWVKGKLSVVLGRGAGAQVFAKLFATFSGSGQLFSQTQVILQHNVTPSVAGCVCQSRGGGPLVSPQPALLPSASDLA